MGSPGEIIGGPLFYSSKSTNIGRWSEGILKVST